MLKRGYGYKALQHYITIPTDIRKQAIINRITPIREDALNDEQQIYSTGTEDAYKPYQDFEWIVEEIDEAENY